jgi:hypothetical protein
MTKLKANKNEIIWNLINSALAGVLVFCGAFTTGKVTWASVMASLAAAVIAFCVQFKEYWIGEKGEYSAKLFKFL